VSTRVLLTGAAGGIGMAAMAELRARGARVVGLDLRPSEPDMLSCDVRDQASVDAAVAEAIARLGGLDVVVNNAGIGTPQSAGVAPDAGAAAVLDVNLVGPWRVTAAALPALMESGGRVVNVASGLAHLTVPFAVAYCMSKRGLVAYSDALRLEYGDRLEAVTTVYPGYVRTAIHSEAAALGVGLEGGAGGGRSRRGAHDRAGGAGPAGAGPRDDAPGRVRVRAGAPGAAAGARPGRVAAATAARAAGRLRLGRAGGRDDGAAAQLGRTPCHSARTSPLRPDGVASRRVRSAALLRARRVNGGWVGQWVRSSRAARGVCALRPGLT
jgi:NAD(P)-dependent dehydrogenase (short-subunit alcohol dehydrogenase family)